MSITDWEQEHSYEQTVEVAIDLSTRHTNRIVDQDLRDALTRAIRDRDFLSLVSWDFDYSQSVSVSDFLEARQAVGYFQKLEPLVIPGIDKEAAARKKFLESEALCRETNQIFTSWSKGALNFPRGVDSILYAAQRKIAKVLGRLPALSELDFVFGPGATTSVPRRKSCSRNKFSERLSCSTNFLEIIGPFLDQVPHWASLHSETRLEWEFLRSNLSQETAPESENSMEKPVNYWNLGPSDDEDREEEYQELLEGQERSWAAKNGLASVTQVERYTVDLSDGIIAFVPKNARTYRTVLTEPTLNTVVQGGYGRWIAKRLKRVGQDIHDQTKNQRLAREGSLTGALATLDLSSASDTISKELVAHLLPYEWYSALDSCRTRIALDGDETIHFEKFSSMGNGFTFPLQTLIFWALVSSCDPDNEQHVSVYGDDIICHRDTVPEVFRVFTCCGFLLNKEKSFWQGPFRESCGKDYYLGINIRPLYLKGLISFEKLFILHNHYYRNFDSEMAACILSRIPVFIRRFGPDGYGDGHLLGDWTPKQHGREDGWGGYLFNTYKKIGNRSTNARPGDRVLPVYSVYVKGDNLASHEDLFSPYRAYHPMTWVGCEEWGPATVPLSFKKKTGVLQEPLPGTKGYKEIQIYTLTYA